MVLLENHMQTIGFSIIIYVRRNKIDNIGLKQLDLRTDGIFLHRPPFEISILMKSFCKPHIVSTHFKADFLGTGEASESLAVNN